MVQGDLPVGERLNRLEADTDKLKIDASKWTLLIGALLALAAALPMSVWFTGLLKKGEDGERGTDGISVPIGGIVAWPSEIPYDGTGDRKQTIAEREWHRRWRICDGTTAPIRGKEDPLYVALEDAYGRAPQGEVLLPNFQGMFLRGSGGTAPHKSSDLGVSQPDSLRGHSHRVFRGQSWNAAQTNPGGESDGAVYTVGGEYHMRPGSSAFPDNNRRKGWTMSSQSVGTAEGRPVNYAVHWIIRVR